VISGAGYWWPVQAVVCNALDTGKPLQETVGFTPENIVVAAKEKTAKAR
jgi:hypothetical protein